MSFWGKVNSFLKKNRKLCCIFCADSCLFWFLLCRIQFLLLFGIKQEIIIRKKKQFWQTTFNAKFPQKILAFKDIRANFLATHCSKHFFVFLTTMKGFWTIQCNRRNAVKRKWLSHDFEGENVFTWFGNAVGCCTAMHVSWLKGTFGKSLNYIILYYINYLPGVQLLCFTFKPCRK